MKDITLGEESQLREKVQDDVNASSTQIEKQESNPKYSSSSSSDDDNDGGSSSDSSFSGRPSFRSRRTSRSQALSRTVSDNLYGVESRRDPELGQPMQQKITTTAPDPNDPDLVTWIGPDDPENPKNWISSRKWLTVFAVSTFTLISPLSSSMVAPALTTIGEEFGVSAGTEQAIILSIFVLAYAIGPLAWGPLSEIYGRMLVLQSTNVLYLFFNLGCGLARTKGQLIAFRFLSGLGGSAPLAIGGGVLGDLFTAEERGKAISLYSLCPLLGPAIGPIIGAFVTQNTTWRWTFYATTIADAVIQVSGLIFLRETYVPVLLAWKRKKLMKETGNENLHTPFDHPDRTLGKTLRIAFVRPFKLLGTQVILQALSLYMMFLYGLMYIVLVSFPSLWASPAPAGYGESLGISGLNYISLGLGFFLGAQVCAPLQDRVYAGLKRRNGGPGRPEYRVPMMVPGAILVPSGLLIYGWTAEYKTHWIGPNIGACIFAAGTIIGFQCVQTFLVDTYTRYAASAVGAATVLRSLAGFGFPLFASSLYDRLGLGWGNTLLAFLAIVIGWPSPIMLWFFGEKLRKRSPFAAGQ
ncbi:major facilitator superfamily domain-containing protein [Truncatella angustata]|uniref:Major facilitator superfamily domain-containing protein n=1 Tax=Truncatella angustata TaxID=152316 RepID=A0A9P8UWT4_9PEZI|nr:major facilitator superfamily domain-containing protein [Truncatella angustata]KAH6659633.1 major facilitator superfamily domain-containing protein [Truncatella angustata]